jgi:hypothetical protein
MHSATRRGTYPVPSCSINLSTKIQVSHLSDVFSRGAFADSSFVCDIVLWSMKLCTFHLVILTCPELDFDQSHTVRVIDSSPDIRALSPVALRVGRQSHGTHYRCPGSLALTDVYAVINISRHEWDRVPHLDSTRKRTLSIVTLVCFV